MYVVCAADGATWTDSDSDSNNGDIQYYLYPEHFRFCLLCLATSRGPGLEALTMEVMQIVV